MEAENRANANALIKALTDDLEEDYVAGKLPREASALLAILEMPRKLVKIGDPRLDSIISTLFDLACSMDEASRAWTSLNDKADEVLKDKTRCVKKKETLEEKANKARETVQEQAQYQQDLQANAARAIQEFRGSQEESEASKWQWQTLIGLATNVLIRAGTEYSKAFAEVKRFEKRISSLTKRLDNLATATEAKSLSFITVRNKWQSTVPDIDTIVRTITAIRE
ncbi:MAG: hypothetical protein Q9195_005742 [Heterodermia aff. obscurata]